MLNSSPVAVGFFLGGRLYGNNSIVAIDSISEGSGSLHCLTNRVDCCRRSDTEGTTVGSWYFPNNRSALENEDSSGSFYETSGPSVVRLNVRHNAMSPTGVLCCEIPDASGTNQTVYVGIYPDGRGVPTINEPLEYVYSNELGQQMLTCTSVGGPATSVSWWENGQPLQSAHNQYQRIADSIDSVYHNVLLLGRASPDEVVGNYTCRVSNDRGEDSETIKLLGKPKNLLSMVYIYLELIMVTVFYSIVCRPTDICCY